MEWFSLIYYGMGWVELPIKNKPKTKIVRGRLGKKSGFKKAVVTLKKGQTIDLATGA